MTMHPRAKSPDGRTGSPLFGSASRAAVISIANRVFLIRSGGFGIDALETGYIKGPRPMGDIYIGSAYLV